MPDNMSNKNPLAPNEGHVEVNLFDDIAIRQVFHDDEWWFSVSDVVKAITTTTDVQNYMTTMRRKDPGLASAWPDLVQGLSIATPGGTQSVNCANAKGIFRIVQSIPSPKAEPLKRWIAEIAYERLQEIRDPELAVKRAIIHYENQGRTKDWIDARLKSIGNRKELCDEWDSRGIKDKEFGVLTAIVAKQTFGLNTIDHREYKGIGKTASLRDHMTDMELILTMLAEKTTTTIVRNRDVRGYEQNKVAAQDGGKVAGDTRRMIEKQTGEPVVSRSNHLPKRKNILP